MTFRKKRILEIERGSTTSHSVEISLWKSVWNCRRRINEWMNVLHFSLHLSVTVFLFICYATVIKLVYLREARSC